MNIKEVLKRENVGKKYKVKLRKAKFKADEE